MDDNCNPIKKFKDYFFSLSGIEYVILADVIGILLSLPLNSDEAITFGNFLNTASEQLITIGAQNVFLGPKKVSIEMLDDILKNINFKFDYFEELLKCILEKYQEYNKNKS